VWDLLSIETLSMMLLHASITMHLLNKSNHRLVTLRVEVDVVTGSNSREPTSTVTKRIITNGVFNIVPEITNKSLAIVQFDSKCLIVDSTPCTIDCLTIALIFSRALLCLSLVAIKKLRSVNQCDGETIDGTWSTIYDQAFRVELNNG
jgi:hypothetical protein